MNFDIIKETTGKASEYAPYVIELYEKRNDRTEPVEDAINRLSKDAALLKGNKNSRKILLCSKTDPPIYFQPFSMPVNQSNLSSLSSIKI